jgi:hypothetical protein
MSRKLFEFAQNSILCLHLEKCHVRTLMCWAVKPRVFVEMEPQPVQMGP